MVLTGKYPKPQPSVGTGCYRVWQLHEPSCSFVERSPLWNATVVKMLEGWNVSVCISRLTVTLAVNAVGRILLAFSGARIYQFSCPSVEKLFLWNAAVAEKLRVWNTQTQNVWIIDDMSTSLVTLVVSLTALILLLSLPLASEFHGCECCNEMWSCAAQLGTKQQAGGERLESRRLLFQYRNLSLVECISC